MNINPLKTFIIYSREDEKYKRQFLRHLKPLSASGFLDIWHDGDILPGEDWQNEIKKNLTSSDLVLVLVSVNSLNSEFIQTSEITTALEQFKLGNTRIVPIIISSCVWKFHPVFRGLQGLPADMKPIDSWGNIDEAWTEVVHKLADLILSLDSRTKTAAPAKESPKDSETKPGNISTILNPILKSGADAKAGAALDKETQLQKHSLVRKIELTIEGLSHSEKNNTYAVVFKERRGKRSLPIIIGNLEAQSIAVAMEGMRPNRPLTHDLMKSILDTLGFSVAEIVINDLLDGVFHARIILKNGKETYELDSRLSDATAMAVRYKAPIYSYEFLLEAAGVIIAEEKK